MQHFMELLKLEFFHNTALEWSLAALAFLATFTVLPLLKGYVGARRRKWHESGRGLPVALDVVTKLISRTSRLFLWTAAVYIGTRFLTLPLHLHRALEILVVITCWLQVGMWVVAVIRDALERRQQKEEAHDAVAAGSLTIIMFVAHLIVWSVVVLLALSNLGINITALVAGLGVGGIAIALAVQTVLGDLLASLAIALDKPFRIGDTLGIDDYTGKVEDIGVKSTRLRSVTGEQLIISNADILKSRVRNLGRMPEQRALLTLVIDYETPRIKFTRIPFLVEEAVKSQPETRFTHCVLKNFGATGLEFEAIYYVLQPKHYAQILNAVNQTMLEKLVSAGIRFAYPTRTPFQPERGDAENKEEVNPPQRSP
jgi:small-conductance mechanosensitive channel